MDEKDRLIKTQTLTRARMGRAGKLTTALSDEQVNAYSRLAEQTCFDVTMIIVDSMARESERIRNRDQQRRW